MPLFNRNAQRRRNEELHNPSQSADENSSNRPSRNTGRRSIVNTATRTPILNDDDSNTSSLTGRGLLAVARSAIGGAMPLSNLFDNILGMMDNAKMASHSEQQVQELSTYVNNAIQRITEAIETADSELSHSSTATVEALISSLHEVVSVADQVIPDGHVRRLLDGDTLDTRLHILRDKLEREMRDYLLLFVIQISGAVERLEQGVQAAEKRDDGFDSRLETLENALSLLAREAGQRADKAEKHLRIAGFSLFFFFSNPVLMFGYPSTADFHHHR